MCDSLSNPFRPAGLTRRQYLSATALGVAGGLMPYAAALAQQWPSKPIRIVTGLSPGSSIDAMARAYGEYYSSVLGVPVVIDNKPGGISMIAAEDVAKAAPDGYTLLFTLQSQLAQAPVLLKKAVDSSKAFIPIAAVSPGTGAFAVKKALPVNSIQEFVAYAKKNEVSIGTWGVAAGFELQLRDLIKQTGVKINIVPYKGTGAMITDLVGGHIDGGAGSLVGLAPGLQSGSIKPIVITTKLRSNKLPNIPTWVDAGFRGGAFENLGEANMLLAPAGTPAPIIERLAGLTLDAVTKSERVKNVRELAGAEDTPVTGPELAKMIQEVWPTYRRLTQALGLAPN